jgi:hypothetical protein
LWVATVQGRQTKTSNSCHVLMLTDEVGRSAREQFPHAGTVARQASALQESVEQCQFRLVGSRVTTPSVGKDESPRHLSNSLLGNG